MNKEEIVNEDIIVLKIMDEIENSDAITQRSLSEKFGVALGLVNTYIKYLVKKGYVRVSQFPRSRYKYLLTPEGISEKSRLAYKHLSYYNNLFRTVRQDSLKLFKELGKKGINEVAFCGIDEVAEISYLSLKESGIKLFGVYEIDYKGSFFDFKVREIKKIKEDFSGAIYISSLKKKVELYKALLGVGVAKEDICFLGDLE